MLEMEANWNYWSCSLYIPNRERKHREQLCGGYAMEDEKKKEGKVNVKTRRNVLHSNIFIMLFIKNYSSGFLASVFTRKKFNHIKWKRKQTDFFCIIPLNPLNIIFFLMFILIQMAPSYLVTFLIQIIFLAEIFNGNFLTKT